MTGPRARIRYDARGRNALALLEDATATYRQLSGDPQADLPEDAELRVEPHELVGVVGEPGHAVVLWLAEVRLWEEW